MNHSSNNKITFKIYSLLLFLLLQLFVSYSQGAQPTAFDSWAKTAKIGGAAVAVGMSAAEISQILDNMVAQKVTVIEADSDLSNYQNDSRFELELDLIRRFSSAAHQRGLRVVWYIPALEVITNNGKNIPSTMAKDHPDWVQKGLTGEPNVFYGGGGQVFWVPKDAESAWMSPSSTGYRQFFFDKVRQLAQTGVDGLWVDVPIYADFGPTKWSGFNAEAVTKFEADSGMSRPTTEDWSDPAWRRWIHWRHEELARFLTDLTNTARSVNSEFSIYAETLPTDYNGGTVYGLDASYLKSIEGLTEVWEIDTMSNNVGMRNAREDDWISFISALKYARAAAGNKPSWVFSYGKQENDAQQVMLQALIAGNNPYELKVPEMTTTVSSIFRTRMFNWADLYTPYLFNAQSTAKTGVFFSSESRDYVDKFSGLGMFATTDSGGDSLWWAGSVNESVYERDYLAEYRGLIKILVHEHIPFNAMVRPDLNELKRYQTVLLPNVEAISDAESNLLRQYVQQGGHLVVTGPNPTGLNEYGNARANYAIADVLGFNKSDPLPTSTNNTFGAGRADYYSQRLGKQYLSTNNATARTTIANTVRTSSSINISTNADQRIYVETSELGEQAVLQFTNFIGLDGSFSVEPQTINVTYTVPELKQVASVMLTNPDTLGANQSNVSFSQNGSEISFNIPVTQYAMVVVSFNNAQTPVHNHTPTAGDDEMQTNIGTVLEFNASTLFANDGDLDGDTLTIAELETTNGSTGSVVNLGGGNYSYTPAVNFTGVDTLRYSVSDGHGNNDEALVHIKVAPSSTYYYPEVITLMTARPDGDNLSYYQQLDGNTYDIRYKSKDGKNVVDWNATTTITEDPSTIGQITIKHIGQYSHPNVSQKAYLYNYQASSWEQFETETVGNEDNYLVKKTLNTNIADYISPQKKMRLRIRGVRSSGDLYAWSDQLFWEVTPIVSISNIAPTAHMQTLEINKNNAKAIVLTATDPEGQALSYSIISQPQHGQISGELPNITYIPSADYVGNDSFTFTANDGVLDSQNANINISVLQAGGNGSVSNPILETAISIDGTISDWSQLQSFGVDGNDMTEVNAQVDWQEAWMAHDTDNIYLAYRNNGVINTSTWWSWAIYLDTDVSSTSGFQVSNNLGAEYLLNGGNLWKYTGTGANWSWSFISGANSSVQNDSAEIKITRSMLGSPSQIHLLFIGDNSAFSATGIDYYPNTANAYFSYQLDAITSNTAPVATAQSLSLENGSFQTITLAATDAENDTLNYSVVAQPSNGVLSGAAPNIIYTPNNGFSGADSFSFKANDSQLDSNVAIINLIVSSSGGDVSNIATISVDGSLSDWGSLQSFGIDGSDMTEASAQVDWQEAWMAHDDNNVYLAYRNNGEINANTWWPWAIYLDTDVSSTSGFQVNSNLGAEYIFNGGNLWKYTGTGTNWSWSFVPGANSHVQDNIVEIKVTRSMLGSPSQIHLLFVGDNSAFSATGIDYYPNRANAYFSYQLDAITSNTAPVATAQSLSLQSSSSKAIILAATDAENNTLSYSIVAQPSNGVLSGVAPNISYTPNNGFSGTDSFSFKANDSQLDSNVAAIILTVTASSGISNPVSSSKFIIDGSITDWGGVQSFGMDGNDITPPSIPADWAGVQADWLEAWMAHDNEHLYLSYHNEGGINTQNWWTWEVYFDTDGDANTGYGLNGIGADYVLDGGTLWHYTGTGGSWSWSVVTTSVSAVAGDLAEIKLPRSALGSPSTLKLVFRAGNGVFSGNYGDESVDYYPNNTANHFQYNMP